MSTYCVSSPEAGTVGKGKWLAFLSTCFLLLQRIPCLSLFTDRGAETEELKGEKLLVHFLLKCS